MKRLKRRYRVTILRNGQGFYGSDNVINKKFWFKKRAQRHADWLNWHETFTDRSKERASRPLVFEYRVEEVS